MKARLRRPLPDFRQRALTEALFMSLGDGAIVTDAEAHISRINKKALDILGFKEKDVLGKWFPEVIIAEDGYGNVLSNTERPIGQVFLTGKTIASRTFYRRKAGDLIPVDLTISPVMLKGRPAGAIEVFRDISQTLALERAKDEFVAIASHQLRTPATAVKQYIGLLLEDYSGSLNDDQRLFLERAYDSNERQLNIVQEILRVTQLDLEKIILKPEVQDVRELIRKAVDNMRSSFDERQQKIVVKLPAEPAVARVDANQLRSALENLLENASHYTWANKTITVSCRTLRQTVKISVQDQGVGIDPADFSKLFQKFSRLPNPLSMEVSGTGLGLYWASRIVQLHAGIITIKSAPKRGSTFTVELPRAV